MITRKALSLLFIASATICLGQKIQIKGGSILVDKKPVGKLEGKATLFNGTNITIKSLTDEPLIIIREKLVSYKSHFQSGTRFTNISFPQSGEFLSTTELSRYTSEKKVISWLFEKSGPHFINEKGLDHELVTLLVNNHNEAQKISDDTVRIKKIVYGYQESLKEPIPPRNLESRIQFKPLAKNEFNWEGYEMTSYMTRTFWEVYQDDVLIGGLIKLQVKANANDTDYSNCEYYLLRRIHPFNIDGQRYDYAPLARLQTYRPGGLQTSIKVEGQGMRTAPNINDFRNSEATLVYTMIQEGLL